ncbi:hypothetical protein SAMD00019534_087630 [Acytostelium subglobosum LB1]|uniref:hypothetical protein n=1 Tax=Acytostelium subglobosum LB1 TaxID=1410327 RepID=UPI0006449D84|nr:hypothetical protein SAMD00019534_087630 [Acytostelium subglobosum LB1]GAM25588.1 hypothetical protein SAMD00019534_087630 [Acytostelium subglobosum LB1]|eukprot:XP_012751574.1 hypothetical protein SAMD00019534_087630 [Acytostelium subglobosum LB1]
MMEGLPILLLRKLVEIIYEPADIICLALTCHRLFDCRMDYIILNNITTSTTLGYKAKHILPCFNQIVKQYKLTYAYNPTPADPNAPVLSLYLPYDFNQPLTNLPNTLTHLETGYKFNQPIGPGTLPQSLTSLKLGVSFNKPIGPGVLPESLKHLALSISFNQPVQPGIFPDKLQVLEFRSDFNQQIDKGMLPKSLRKLSFDHWFNKQLKIGVLPEGLEELVLGWKYIHRLEHGVLPQGLQKLSFGHDYNQPLEPGQLPDSITFLSFGTTYNQPLASPCLPASLIKLSLPIQYSHPLGPAIPTGFKHLILQGTMFEDHTKGLFPTFKIFLHPLINNYQARFVCFVINYRILSSKHVFDVVSTTTTES